MGSHDLILGHNHHEFVMGQDHSHALVLEYSDDHKLDLARGQEHDQIDDQNHVVHNPDQLTIHQAHELVLSHNHHQLALVDSNLDDLAVCGSHELVLHQSAHLMMTPILQNRLTVNLTHDIHVGQEFPDVRSCRRALRDAAIACHFEIQTVKSDKSRFTARCRAEGCPWRIHAAKLPGVPAFTIRTINGSHNCFGISHLGHHQASVQWVANSVEDRLRENPKCKPKEILEEIHRIHGITLSYKQAWRGKERIMASVRGSFEEGYRLLPQYCDQIKKTNPGSMASVYGHGDDNCFKRLFISFYASIYGFVHACRPLMGLDRALLKSKYLGTLLLATGVDGDGAIFPLAFGVVDEETEDNWIWFLSELRYLLENNTENMPRLTILSDRQKGITDGVEFNFPTAFHGFCMRHLTESFSKEFPNHPNLINLFWEAAQSLTAIDFETKLLAIEDSSKEAAHWIRAIPPRLWATSYFEGTRFGHLTANIAETLNNWLIESSVLPINQMMELIRRQLMIWFNDRRETSMRWSSVLVPSAEQKISESVDRSREYRVGRSNEAEFEVVSPNEGSFIVDIRNRCCLCRGWQLCGIPCAHGVSALVFCRQNVHRYAESCFTVAAYRKTYSETIHPIPDRSLWKELEGNCGEMEAVINPPRFLRPEVRKKKKRGRLEEKGRMKRVVHCSRCNQTGHFRTTCAAPI